MRLKLPSLEFLATEARRTFVRFPYVVISALTAAGYSISMVENKISPDDDRLIFTIALGIPLFLALTLWRESRGWNSTRDRLLELAAGVGFLAAHYLLTVHDTTGNYLLKYLHVSLALHLLVAFIAFLKRGSEQEFWQFNRFVFLRILLSTLYAAVFFGGLAIALIAIEKLFSVDIKPERYFELWLLSVFVLQTCHFLAGLPGLASLRSETSYPKGLRIFVQYLLIPLVSLYMVILYCYMAKILLTWDWPKGYIGWLVSIMSVLGIFNLLLIDPEKNRSESRWIAVYSKFYYVLILPLLVMLFIAIGKRVSEYGVTEQRYFLIVLGGLLTGLALYFVFSVKKNIKVIPISLFVLAVLTLWGPWSAYSVSLRAQRQRALVILQKYQLLKAQSAQPGKVEYEERKNLSSILDYIVQSHGPDAMADWFPESVRSPLKGLKTYRYRSAQPLMAHLGLEYLDRWGNREKTHFAFQSPSGVVPFDVAGYNQAILVSFTKYDSSKPVKVNKRTLTLDLDNKKLKLRVLENSKELFAFDLSGAVEKVKTTVSEDERAPLLVEGQGGGIQMRLLISGLNAVQDENQTVLQDMSGLLLLK